MAAIADILWGGFSIFFLVFSVLSVLPSTLGLTLATLGGYGAHFGEFGRPVGAQRLEQGPLPGRCRALLGAAGCGRVRPVCE